HVVPVQMHLKAYAGLVAVLVNLKLNKFKKQVVVPILFCICVTMCWTICKAIKSNRSSINTQTTSACQSRCKKKSGRKKKQLKGKHRKVASMSRLMSGKRLTRPAHSGHGASLKLLKNNMSSSTKT